MLGSKGLDHRNLRQNIYLLGSFDGNWKRPAQPSKNIFASAAFEFHMQGKTKHFQENSAGPILVI